MTAHPLLAHLVAAADGAFPPVDGGFDVLPPDDDGTVAVVEFTGHAFVLADSEEGELREMGVDGFGGASHPDVQLHLAGPDREIGCHDAVLVRRVGDPEVKPLRLRPDLADHPRAVRARQHRRNIAVYGDETGVVILGEGLVGRTEIGVEVLDPAPHGAGRALIAAGLATLPPGDLVFAQVTPGNAASLRAFLACGFDPICSEILIRQAT